MLQILFMINNIRVQFLIKSDKQDKRQFTAFLSYKFKYLITKQPNISMRRYSIKTGYRSKSSKAGISPLMSFLVILLLLFVFFVSKHYFGMDQIQQHSISNVSQITHYQSLLHQQYLAETTSQDVQDLFEDHGQKNAVKQVLQRIAKRQDPFAIELATRQKYDLAFIIHQQVEVDQKNYIKVFKQHKLKQISPLHTLKHKKFTSTIAQPQSSWFGSIAEFFIKSDKYENVNQIYTQYNQECWYSTGNKLTLYGDQAIVPYFLILKFPQQLSRTITLLGINLEQNTIAITKSLSSYFLVRQESSSSQVIISCTSINCNNPYSFLMMIVEPAMQICSIEIFVSS